MARLDYAAILILCAYAKQAFLSGVTEHERAKRIDIAARVGKNDYGYGKGRKVAYTAPSIEEYVAGEVVKYEPKSEGQTNKRKRKPHILAVINENCTGCSGSPACVEYCPVEDCMFWSPDPDHAPFGRIIVDPLLCIGCKLCTSKGPDGAFLEGCPWDAIDMVPLAEFEAGNGSLPY